MNIIVGFFYGICVLLSFLIPRRKDLWVFGNKKGYFDNTKYFFEYASARNDVRCVWLAVDDSVLDVVREAGYDAHIKNSPKGIWLAARASVHFICNGLGDVHRALAWNARVVNFWHGTPIKKIFLDSEYDTGRLGDSGVARSISKYLLRLINGRVFVYYASSEFERDLVARAAGIPLQRAVSIGSPRFDYIRDSFLGTKVDFGLSASKVFLYAPTWRENAKWHSGYRIQKDEIDALSAFLEKIDGVLLIKAHPLTSRSEVESWGVLSCSRVLLASDYGINDINQLYSISDVLVTDVSSSVFDYIIFGRPVVFFMPDVVEYLGGSRGLYEYFTSFLLREALSSWSELVGRLEYVCTGECEVSGDIFQKVFADISGKLNINEAIYADLLSRIRD